MKKVLSLVLAMALVLALAVPAFATNEMNITGTVEGPTINVTVPTSAALVVNPYKLAADIPGGTAGTDTSTDQIIFPAQILKNTSLVDVNVSVEVTGTPSTGVVFATAPIATSTKAVTTKSVFMYVDVQETTDDDPDNAPAPAAFDSKSTSQAVVSAKATTKNNIFAMKKSADGTTATCAAVQLAGDAAAAPTVPWSDDDTVNVKLAFTFTATTIPTT